MTLRLHYIYDPLCGWCYAAAPLVAAVQAVPGVELILHGGGLFAEPTGLAAPMRQHIRASDARIAEMSGQEFGSAYLDGLLNDPSTIFHSAPTIAAILAAEQVAPGHGPAMLKAIQHAHYVEGRRVVEPAVLTDLAQAIGLLPDAFEAARRAYPVDSHVNETRRTMASFGVRGFPGLLREEAGQIIPLPLSDFYGRPDAFTEMVRSRA
ncbi:DsbA family protein [Azorhizobium sp. AG788]|uniref:DsbA family protein n=1 Tax=Azorhizobium sp. AG788 TaxID=2183897 RepID=UPI003138F6BF